MKTNVFYPYLVDEILEKAYYKDKIVVVRRIEKIKINLNGALANINMSDSSHSEADTRIVLHVFPCVHSGLKDIYVRANDMDIVVIVVAYMPDFLEIYSNVRVSVVSGVGFNTSCISVNAIAAYIGLKKVQRIVVFALFFRFWLYLKLLFCQKGGILGWMTKEFSFFWNISVL